MPLEMRAGWELDVHVGRVDPKFEWVAPFLLPSLGNQRAECNVFLGGVSPFALRGRDVADEVSLRSAPSSRTR
jgi:hypothetical protein